MSVEIVENPRRRRRKATRRKRRNPAPARRRRRRTTRNPSRIVVANPRRRRRRRTYRNPTMRGLLRNLTSLAVDSTLASVGLVGSQMAVSRFAPGVVGWPSIALKAGMAVAVESFGGRVLGAKNARSVALGAGLAAVQEAATMLNVPYIGGGGGTAGVAAYLPGWSGYGRDIPAAMPDQSSILSNSVIG